MKWKKRTRGTPNQVGRPFPVAGKRKLPKVVYPIKYEKKKIDKRRLFKRFFGLMTRGAYDQLRDNIIPESQAHFLLSDGSTIIAAEFPEAKSEWRWLVKKAVKSENPIAYAIITPIWLSPADVKVKPSAHPFRKEGVIVTAYSPAMKRAAFVEFERLTPKLIEVKKPDVWKEFDDSLVGNVYRQ